MSGKFLVKVVEKRQIAEGTIALYLEKPLDFVYQAGQFVLLELPQIANEGRKESCRSMSLASAPHEDYLMVSMRLSDSLFKKTVNNLKIGDEIELNGPFGHLTIEKAVSSVVFIAGGIGIAPFRSIITDQEKKGWPIKINLFYASKNPQNAAFLGELKDIKNQQFMLTATMSRVENGDPCWQGECGRISKELLERKLSGIDGQNFYIVGLPEMVKETKDILQQMGVSPEKVFVELFTGY